MKKTANFFSVHSMLIVLMLGSIVASAPRSALAQKKWLGSQGTNVPTFSDYNVQEIFKEVPARINSGSHRWAREFRTVLSIGARKGPNFAGHFTLVHWGCGSSCQAFAIVDAKSGYVFALTDPKGGVPAAAVGLKFEVDSRLLIVNPIEILEEQHPESILRLDDSRFYVWENNRLKQIFKLSPTRPSLTK